MSYQRLPTLFVSHGSPMAAVDGDPARDAWRRIGETLPRPRAVVVLSPHWSQPGPVGVASAAHQTAEHDFGGFPPELYRLRYDAVGSREVADRVLGLLAAAGVDARPAERSVMDHGVWIPLAAMYSDAAVPVVQIAQPQTDAAGHLALGRALARLREEQVLVIGSGSLTHNLYVVERGARGAPVHEWVDAFRRWMLQAVERGDGKALARYRELAPQAQRNHPTDEHLLPLHFAFAAGGETPGLAVYSGTSYGALAMEVCAFGAEAAALVTTAARRVS